jgi:hypothetical protein
MVITSREAGFRHVAAHLAPICTHATLSLFDENDIRRLSMAWHREVAGDTEKVRTDAEELAATIARNDRIKRLAVNPLLLTTLLLVKRWVGSLPTRRAVLYGKAVEVLLMTWNTEGHAAIPEEEALPQLCYVAAAMMLEGLQKISRPRLASLLQEARAALPTELGYVKGTVDEFIHRVEDRSSLLMMTGHDVEDGRLVEFFEFRHLTFQEFLTSRAMVEGWNPDRKEKDTLTSVLLPYLEKEEWREVIPLAAVLGGKATETLIQRLTEKVSAEQPPPTTESSPLFLALGNCLADEAAARPETIRAAIRELMRLGKSLESIPFTQVLARGRYGPDFREETWKAILAGTLNLVTAMKILSSVVWWQEAKTEDFAGLTRAAAWFSEKLKDLERVSRCEGALCCMKLCSSLQSNASKAEFANFAGHLRQGGEAILPLLFSTEIPEQCAATWALIRLGACRVWVPPAEPDMLGRLFMLSRTSPHDEIRRSAQRALANQPIAPREDRQRCSSVPRLDLAEALRGYGKMVDSEEKLATLTVAWYRYSLGDPELAARAQALIEQRRAVDDHTAVRTLRELLEHLGAEPKLSPSSPTDYL